MLSNNAVTIGAGQACATSIKMQSGSDGVRTRGHLVKSQVLYLTKLQTQPRDPPTLYERDGIKSSRLVIKIIPTGKESRSSRSSQSTIGFLEYTNP